MSTQLTICVPGDLNDEIVETTYVQAFPNPAERYNLADYAKYIEEGCVRLDVTKVGERVVTVSIVEDLGKKGALLAYLWTDEQYRNQGIGSKHLDALRAKILESSPDTTIFLEVEDPNEERIGEEERAIRQRRKDWYERRHGAQSWQGRYIMPNLQNRRLRGVPAVLMAISPRGRRLSDEEFVDAAIYVLVNSYEISERHRLVRLVASQRPRPAQHTAA